MRSKDFLDQELIADDAAVSKYLSKFHAEIQPYQRELWVQLSNYREMTIKKNSESGKSTSAGLYLADPYREIRWEGPPFPKTTVCCVVKIILERMKVNKQ